MGGCSRTAEPVLICTNPDPPVGKLRSPLRRSGGPAANGAASSVASRAPSRSPQRTVDEEAGSSAQYSLRGADRRPASEPEDEGERLVYRAKLVGIEPAGRAPEPLGIDHGRLLDEDASRARRA
jgi:hypothetical protein